ncbi:hypothetical protein J2R98_001298 [Alkalibacillus filiformis]|uniref:DUF1541 domain-containing protein n=1 Tax=Alkalibacillus filiformis TaxID=200990 RepID=A0ABU0DSQ8_9BACI|nr:YdhK family protein [Alkalibacillus filiformis]MDQ0351484.1 hypothetical protein [Alkalibacillus filiformis]
MKSLKTSLILLFVILLFTACNTETEDPSIDDTEADQNEEETDHDSDSHDDMDHSGMEMSGSGEVPEGLEEAENPTYEVNSHALIEDGHMEGMEGAEATIVGAYNTTVYSVSYTPTDGGERVTNHKWVIHEELEDAGEAPLEPGDEAIIDASHMEGMDGATAEIDSVEETTVYMIDFELTTTGEKVTNHKWVTEGELGSVE